MLLDSTVQLLLDLQLHLQAAFVIARKGATTSSLHTYNPYPLSFDSPVYVHDDDDDDDRY
jgi:hypothetical protein